MCANNFIIKVFPCNFLCLFKGTGSVLASVQWELAVRPKKLSNFLNYNFPKWLFLFKSVLEFYFPCLSPSNETFSSLSMSSIEIPDLI